MDFWHASRAKNTTHRVAIAQIPLDIKPEKTLLVNLDADNILAPGFLVNLAKTAATAAEPWQGGPRPTIRSAGGGPLTGRVAIFAKTFLCLGGYDEEEDIAPSGS